MRRPKFLCIWNRPRKCFFNNFKNLRHGRTWGLLPYIISNISIRTHFKHITRVDLKLENLYNTLREITCCAWRHVICCRSFTNVLFDHFYCSVQSYNNVFLLREMWIEYVETMSLNWNDNIYDREFTMHNMNEWALSRCYIYVAYNYIPRIPMIWRQGRAIVLSPRDTTSCIRQGTFVNFTGKCTLC